MGGIPQPRRLARFSHQQWAATADLPDYYFDKLSTRAFDRPVPSAVEGLRTGHGGKLGRQPEHRDARCVIGECSGVMLSAVVCGVPWSYCPGDGGSSGRTQHNVTARESS